jgi:4-diphosphocytidyl-2-C-methyl-D-erythritol kinase
MTSFQAPAKLNLSLQILHARPDGFHEIDTLMVKLPGLADSLHFTPAAEFSFTCDDADIPADERNLVVKAVRAYETATSSACRTHIALEKRIPHGAGLGGGSSDTATTLLALNQLHHQPLKTADLQAIAASIGSDVPFFLGSGAARCKGRGELIEAIASPPALPVLLLKPGFNVATPDAYQRWKTSFELPGIRYATQQIAGIHFINDLERPVFEKHRFLAELKHWLLNRKETLAALMSGSGSTVFTILRDLSDADSLIAAARTELDPELWAWAGVTESILDCELISPQTAL